MNGARLASAGVAVTLALALKKSCSLLDVDALVWILAPSSHLAALLGGIDFTWTPGRGFVSHESRVVVGQACAGVSFLVAAWLAVYFAGERHRPSARARFAWLVAALGIAFVTAVVVNAVRIALATHAFGLDVYGVVVTKTRVHRVLGIVLYCTALFGVCELTRRTSTVGRHRPASAHVTAFACYLGIALGVPLVHRAWIGDPARFVEHAAWTVCVAGALLLAVRISGKVVDRVCSRTT